MLSISTAQRYFIYTGFTDMRKGVDTLCGVVRLEFKMNPLSGDVFIFLSRTRNRIKLLHWQGDGYAMYFKRLEKGTFELPKNINNISVLSSQHLIFMMEGIQLSSIKKRIRYEHPFVNKNSMESAVSVDQNTTFAM